MKEFKNKVAVITGAANGIGLELSKEAAKRGMKVVMADIAENDLNIAFDEVKKISSEVIKVVMDVTIFEDMVDLSKKATDSFEKVDLFFNNAGVVVPGPIWEIPNKDIDYIMQSNVYSIAYGLKVFIPLMMKQGTPAHIVNTASVAGLLSSPGMPTYHMTKFANVGLSESVNYQLRAINSNIKMSVYCPGFIQTDLNHCDKRRPKRFEIDKNDPYYTSQTYKDGLKRADHVINTGIPIDSVGMSVFQAIEDEQFYILTHPQYNPVIGLRVKTILEGKNPDISIFKK
ncbi:SDR family NAD(P)-dependent oxidoreductase [Oceanotoga sp. DSM 15011]|jgi:NAD(P)-dependent dehydrogenase (short-subunit alcohol dehydrogenase family)|uniref:SDR family NAD(P)-dependent oxidoreductase n=1 Tax=Oceanotoga TaxID=1255275 RepID=UPI0021F3EB18|nr:MULTISPECIES: SDR family NAD(P)-dependent oxidoreductase [Oceanotoga]MDO7977805.1 SDR family NAD(P)-dependent oxidoreductase [Oceanotoga teriensis]UYP01186.1 SDR family NAD(P)-dependent oxidoreductase [Oceanotoga sp. DSM 15011]